jgi:hypothetical protein
METLADDSLRRNSLTRPSLVRIISQSWDITYIHAGTDFSDLYQVARDEVFGAYLSRSRPDSDYCSTTGRRHVPPNIPLIVSLPAPDV